MNYADYYTLNNLTGDKNIDAVIDGTKWNENDISYKFPTSLSHFPDQSEESVADFVAFNSAWKISAREIFNMYESYADLTFTEVSANGDATLVLSRTNNSNLDTAYAYLPDWTGSSLQVYKTSNYSSNPKVGTYTWHTLMHEIGHSLGLKHGHEAERWSPLTGSQYTSDVLDYNKDSMEFSVMTYRPYVGANVGYGYTNEEYGYAQSLMMYDIAAIQHMYGANYDTNSSNSIYTFSEATGEMFINGIGQGRPGDNRIFLTIWDGGGEDTYDFSNYSNGTSIDLAPGSWSKLSDDQIANLGNYNDARANVFNALLHDNNENSLIENAIGGAGNDYIYGNQTVNKLFGNQGDDNINGEAGNDILVGGEGNDTLYGGDDHDSLEGGIGADHLDGGNGSDMANYYWATGSLVVNLSDANLNTGDASGDSYVSIENIAGSRLGDDHLTGTNYANVINGHGGSDTLYGLSGDDTLIGEDNNDVLYGGSGKDHLDGGGMNDILVGGEGNDTLYGGDDHDSLEGGLGADHLDGGDGGDTANYYWATGGLTVNLTDSSLNTGDATGDTYVNMEHIAGSRLGNDNLTGNGWINFINGNGGNDIISGMAGNDILVGGEGNDTLYGGDDHDSLEGGLGADHLDGGDGGDTANYYWATGGLTVNLTDSSLNSGDATGDTYANMEHIAGSRLGNDNLTGNGWINFINGNGGNDIISGMAGNDILVGGEGNDTLYGGDDHDSLEGGLGADHLDGGDGGDTANYYWATGGLTVNLTDSSLNSGDATGDTYANMEHIAGSRLGNDNLTGNGWINFINGNGGNDIISGMAGNDILVGGEGNDTLYGGDDHDSLEGGLGADHLDGGDGSDAANYYWATGGLIVNLTDTSLNTGDATGDTYSSIENIVGSRLGDDHLTGDAGNNTLIGEGGFDVLIGGKGDDILIGGSESDMFVFSGINIGNDRIDDFISGSGQEDIINFDAIAGINDFLDVIAIATDDGTDTTISLDASNSIILKNTLVANLHQDDFTFT